MNFIKEVKAPFATMIASHCCKSSPAGAVQLLGAQVLRPVAEGLAVTGL